MEIIDAPLDCLNIPLPRCIRKLVKMPPVPTSNPSDEDVINLIRGFGRKYDRDENEIQKACDLATGYSDLIIILERPAPNHKYSVGFKQFVADCPTLDAVDNLIKFATNKTRSIETVSVFDALSLKPNKNYTRPSNDECYSLLEEMIRTKKPKVVVCCWSDWNAACSNEFVRQFIGGGVGGKPIRVDVDVEWGSLVAIRSFHPATAVCYKKHNPDYRVLLIYHFISAFSERALSSVAIDPEHKSGLAVAMNQLMTTIALASVVHAELINGNNETALALASFADAMLSRENRDPKWLEKIKTRVRSSINETDYLDKLRGTHKYEAAYNRAFDIIYNILGESRSQIIDTKVQNSGIYLLLQRLKDSAYNNGSTEISKLYLLWQEYFKLHPDYKLGLGLLIGIASRQEWFDPTDDSRDSLAEALQNLDINKDPTLNATLLKGLADMEADLI